MTELKPCPFCGGIGKLSNETKCYGHGDYATETFVCCSSCGARGATISDHDIGNEVIRIMTACNAWNRRADDA